MDSHRFFSVSFVLPAFNEEQNLGPTIEVIRKALGSLAPESRLVDYEILIVNDGSTDRTGEIAEKMVREDPHLRVIHNEQNRGNGYSVLRGRREAKMDYSLVIGADNDITADSIIKILGQAGKADLIVAYIANSYVRPLARRIISQLYVFLMYFLFRKKMRYYNGPCLIRREVFNQIRDIPFSSSYAIHSEILLTLLHRGASFHEVGINIVIRPQQGKSMALSWASFLRVAKALISLWVRIHRHYS